MKGNVRGFEAPPATEDGTARLVVQVTADELAGLRLGEPVVILAGDALEAVRVALKASVHYSAGQVRRAARALGGL